MKTDNYFILEILKDGQRFMVPLYQRKYQWGDDRILSFWEDVEAKAGEVLEGESKFVHYMGALILSPVDEVPQHAVTPKMQVVDGQQRLTTFQLFLAALREVAREHGCEELIEDVKGYLFNHLQAKDKDPLARFKLVPTPKDRDVFHSIIEKKYQSVRSEWEGYWWGSRVPKNTPFRALRAYELFKGKIEIFRTHGPTNSIEGDSEAIPDENDTIAETGRRLAALLKALLSHMKLVVITLEPEDDAQVIFETLNSKGEPLLAMDLVRNNIFHRAEREGTSVDELYRNLWDPFDAHWWRENAPFARPRRPRIDHFLAHTLTAETGERISMRELYAEYRAFAVPKGRPRFERVEDELQMLQRYAPLYETLEGQKNVDETLAWLGRKLSAWQVTTAYPIAMQLMQNSVPLNERRQIGQLIYSYIVRRALSGLTSKNLNRVFQSLARLFVQSSPSVIVLTDYFTEHTGDSIRFPSDEEFREGILSKPAYYLAHQSRIKDVLCELELASRPRFTEQTIIPDGLWTEHVLPTTWNENWPFEDGNFVERFSSDQKVVRRNALVHTLGNLTLLTRELNIAAGNRSFKEKRLKFENSGLFLNKWFAKKLVWAEEEILERSGHMATLAIRIWPSL